MIEIVDSPRGQIRDYVWSPRGNYLAFTMVQLATALPPSMFGMVQTTKYSGLRMKCSALSTRPGIRRETTSTSSATASSARKISNIEFNFATNRDATSMPRAAQGREKSFPAGKRRGHVSKEAKSPKWKVNRLSHPKKTGSRSQAGRRA